MVISLIQEYKNKILNQCYADVLNMIDKYEDDIREFADILKEKEEMTGEEIEQILYAKKEADAE